MDYSEIDAVEADQRMASLSLVSPWAWPFAPGTVEMGKPDIAERDGYYTITYVLTHLGPMIGEGM